MSDSWTSPVWDGFQWLYGAAAREYRIKKAGGVDTIIFNAATAAVKNAFSAVEQLTNSSAKAKNNVVGIRRIARSKTR
ncbi:hypothetical protein [Pseudomonas sp. HS6]|uniref:hypothetical protein n=1 Tax=Pseudomonas sp. HS6 TaxID=2850559 RepID=UPI0020187F94|nr:hypothetical protein [Pseudomonas sp. HS6]UQS13309.1 hypothetical protein JJN09_19025 [Pseudomonas sp. HS6]